MFEALKSRTWLSVVPPARIARLFALAVTAFVCVLDPVGLTAETLDDVLYREDFEAYGANANPDGWVDTAVGRPGPAASGLFRTSADPAPGSGSQNTVYGTRASAGTPVADSRRAGTFSTLVSHAFEAESGFEVSGRALRMKGDGLLGLAVLSQYPDRDDYYIVGMDGEGRFGAYTWDATSRPGRRRPVVPNRLGLVPLDGTASVVDPVPTATWHRFRIRVTENGGATLVVASIWAENEPAPSSFEIRAEDSSSGRLRAGRIALWSGERGDVWFDGIDVRSLAPVSAGGPPVISILESGRPMIDGILVNRDLTPVVKVTDDFDLAPRVVISLDGVSWRSGSLVSAEGAHTLRVVATDSTGMSAERTLPFEIDKTPPLLTLTSHSDGQVVTGASAVLSGGVEGADWARAGGQSCSVDTIAKSWTSPPLALLEGSNTIAIIAGDRAGNTTPVSRTLNLDTRGPALEIVSPPSGTSLNVANLTLTGRASDERLASVKVRAGDGGTTLDALLSDGAWSVTIPSVTEGPLNVSVVALDSAGHSTAATAGYRIDRSAPVIEITEGGASFVATVVNRIVGLFIRAIDADPEVSVTSALDGGPYNSGAAIERDGEHVIESMARDHAGNESRKTTRFRIDRVPPTLNNLAPASGATAGTPPVSIAGSSDDATRVEIAGTAISATTTAGAAFTLGGVPFDEGTNRFTLRATDEAGNASELAYVVTVKTSSPAVEILESGTPIAENALFNRDITPEIRASDSDATITTTLNGAAFAAGTAITSDGVFTLNATASDALGHTGSKSATFRIDKTAPSVAISSPTSGGALGSDTVEVIGTSGDATSVTVNGVAATLSSGGFSATVSLELGENVLVAIGRDGAGNTGRAEVSVTRAGAGPAIVLLYPTDKSITNRPSTELLGRVITPANVASVTIALGGQTKATLTPDAAGDFRLSGLRLIEGDNAIIATAVGKDGTASVASVSVEADFTAPSLRILANGSELSEAARFSESANLTLEAADSRLSPLAPRLTLFVDASNVPDAAATVTARGGHVAIATARDAAGNEARVERTFTIGAASSASSCSITKLDPDPGKPGVIAATSTRISGRTTAEAVRVGGIVTDVVSGSFCADVQLPREGANPVEIVCLSGGEPIGTPVTLELTRATGLPTVAIDSPVEGQVLTNEAVTVTGSAGPSVTAVSVNGVDATFSSSDASAPRTFVAQNVEIAHGQNLIAARAMTASGRAATTTRRATGAIRAATLTITSPIGAAPTGGASIDVSGTWSDLEPGTITSSSGAVTATSVSDTEGTFVVREAALTIGANTITVRGRDAANRETTAQVSVIRTAGVPSSRIESPADNTRLASGAAATISVSGSFAGDEGSRVEVNGVGAAITGSAFTAEVSLAATPGVPTPLIARVIEPDGGLAVAAARVVRLAGAFEVRKVDGAFSVFPADGTVAVPVSAQILVALSHPVSRASIAGSIVVETAAGQPVSGTLFADREVVGFAPNVPLAEGTSYVVRVGPSLTNGAGETLGAEVTARFMTELGAPSAAPSLDAPPASVCGEQLTVSGTTLANARVRIDFDAAPRVVTATSSGRFTIDLPLTGPSGYRVLRVRAIGADGALSPAVEACILVVCEAGPAVLSASYDDLANRIAIGFSAAVDPATLGVGTSITLMTSDNRSVGGAVSLTGLTASVQPSENLANAGFTLTVTTAVKDLSGRALAAPFSQSFFPGGSTGAPSAGFGYVTGEIYDATTGRPLAGARVALVVPAASARAPAGFAGAPERFAGAPAGSAGAPASLPAVPPASLLAVTDSRGRYTIFVPEGAHTIEVSAPNYTTVWRQVIVPAGAGVIPIDIRLEARGEGREAKSGEVLVLVHGSEANATTPVSLNIPSGSLTAGSHVTLTAVGAQSLAGLLPLGWSPLASAEVVVTTGTATGRVVMSSSRRPYSTRPAGEDYATAVTATISFTIDAAAVTNAAQTLSAVRYDPARDEWRVVNGAISISGNTASINITRDGAYAVVYPDKGTSLATPPIPTAGLPLAGVVDPCVAPGACGPITNESFTLIPPIVMPDQRATARLEVDSALSTQSSALFPSGSAVQASIDEELRLADGSVLSEAPFAADLLLYRDLDGSPAVATFHLAPSKRATEIFLQVGYEHIRINPYPGRLDRGTLIGSEGGRVPGDGSVTVDIPAGATPEPVRAEVHPIQDLTPFGTINGFTIISAFEFELSRATQPAASDLDGDGQPDAVAPVELLKSASATFALATNESRQLIVAEVIESTPYGRVFRLASACGTPTAGEGSGARVSTESREELALDGIIREGRYLLLAASQEIAYATGLVRLGSATGPVAVSARVSALDAGSNALGVADVTRVAGLYATPVIAAAPVLRPETASLGKGTPYTHGAAVAADSVLAINLILAPHPPTVTGSTPSANATEVSLTTSVQVVFSANIDPTSITADSITVVNALSGLSLPGATVVPGPGAAPTQFVTWNLAKDSSGILIPLKPNARYSVRVAPTVRATNGAPLGKTHTFSFATLTQIVSTEVNRGKIRITIPNATGVSTIVGSATAIPAGWIAVPVRRVRDFTTRYQATAATDGSFSMTIGSATGDAVAITDAIDLQIVNTAGILSGIIRLTPFVGVDGISFIAPPDQETRFTSAEKITVIVPAGAFDEPTLVSLAKETKASFSGVPNFDAELGFAGAVNLTFDGIAKKKLQLEIPPTTAIDPTKQYYLGWLGRSIRGPRVMIVDTVSPTPGGTLTTVIQGSAQKAGARSATRSATSLDTSLKPDLLGVVQPGTYTTFSSVVAWISTLVPQGSDVFISTRASLYLSDYYVQSRAGRVVIPVVPGTPFVITGVDATTNTDTFSQGYDGINPPDPDVLVPVASPEKDRVGPYPVWASPFRTELIDVRSGVQADRGIRTEMVAESLRITRDADAPVTQRLSKGTVLRALHVASGRLITTEVKDDGGEFSLTLPGVREDDRVLLTVGVSNVPSSTAIAIVFNEPIQPPVFPPETPSDAIDALERQWYEQRFTLLKRTGSESQNVTPHVEFSLDSQNRRVQLRLGSALVMGAEYYLLLEPSITDTSGNPLATTANPEGAKGQRLILSATVREPQGELGAFDIEPSAIYTNAAIRDFARSGKLVFVAASDGGIVAYDLTDPKLLNASADVRPEPVAVVPARWTTGDGTILTGGLDEHWAVAADQHGRIYSTGLTTTFGVLRSYRVEDFVRAREQGGCDAFPQAPDNALCKFHGASIVAWRPGMADNLSLSSFAVSNRPEGLPRKVRIVAQDDTESPLDREAFKTKYAATVQHVYKDGNEKLSIAVPVTREYPYLSQRLTIENMTTGLRFSADSASGVAAISGVYAAKGDLLRVIRNLRTWAVVSVFGYGIATYDLNAIESNDATTKPADYKALPEPIILTTADADSACTSLPPAPASIDSLALSPEALILTSPEQGSDLAVYAPDLHKGLLDLRVALPVGDAGVEQKCIQRSNGIVLNDRGTGYRFPRFEDVETRFRDLGKVPRVRFSGIDHLKVFTAQTPGTPGGVHDYALVPASDYGLLVIELAATPPDTLWPDTYPLNAGHLVDVIWIPGGAWSVRVVAGTTLAAVVDGSGRVLIVDLSRVDERYTPAGKEYDLRRLFPTALKALGGTSTDGVGDYDPRVLWKSEPGVALGTIAPLIDPETGIAIGGEQLGKKLKVLSIRDPQVRVKLMKRDGSTVESGVITPLGTELTPQAGAGAFRLELALPGKLAEAGQPNVFSLAIESEEVWGALAAQTPVGTPAAHLRTTLRNGEVAPRSTTITLRRPLPEPADAADAEEMQRLRYQDGYHRYVTPWIVPVSDPRASAYFVAPPGGLTQDGCINCERPTPLVGKREADGVYELWSGGRYILIRPDGTYDGEPSTQTSKVRLDLRVPTTMADTVVPAAVHIAGQNPPVAEGMLQDRIFLHSGEVAVSDIDGGLVARSYRSRVFGMSRLGLGWDSPMFRRLRPLPSGAVEYRDGTGEVWLFKGASRSASLETVFGLEPGLGGTRRYESPDGLFLTLAGSESGWVLFDQQFRVTKFDRLGRIILSADEFWNPRAEKGGTRSGSTTQYLYDSSGRLARIVDAEGREATLDYWPDTAAQPDGGYAGLLREVRDWRGRTITYRYDAQGRLRKVVRPEVVPASGTSGFTGRPTIEYTYLDKPAPGADEAIPSQKWTDVAELAGNLVSVTEPAEVAKGGIPRVRYLYHEEAAANSPRRDQVVSQTWPCGSVIDTQCQPAMATFDQTGTTTTVIDALGQKREYELAANPDGAKRWVTRRKLFDVPTYERITGKLPPAAPLGEESRNATLETVYANFNRHGQPKDVTYPHRLFETKVWRDAENGAAGTVQTGAVLSLDQQQLHIAAQFGEGPYSVNTWAAIGYASAATAALEFRDTPSPDRSLKVTAVRDEDSTVHVIYDERGRPTQKIVTAGSSVDSDRSFTESYTYYLDSADAVARGRLKTVTRSDNALSVEYAYAIRSGGGETITTNDKISGTSTVDDHDAGGKLIHRKITTTGIAEDEWFAYDASGMIKETKRRQNGSDVTMSIVRDPLGREIASNLSGAVVEGEPATLVTLTSYDLVAKTVTTTEPRLAGGKSPVRKTQLDGLGRPYRWRMESSDGSTSTTSRVAYDITGQVSYETDESRSAIVHLYDFLGREAGSVDEFGLRHELLWSAWSQPLEEKWLASTGTGGEPVLTGHQSRVYTSGGTLRETRDETVAGTQFRVTRFAAEKGGSKENVRIAATAGATMPVDGAVRLTEIERDLAGRITKQRSGQGQGLSGSFDTAGVYHEVTASNFKGLLPQTLVTAEPRVGSSFETSMEYDGLGRVKRRVDPGGHTAGFTYDEAGNILSTERSGHENLRETFDYDSRGLVLERTAAAPGGPKVHDTYDTLGTLVSSTDESGQKTTYVTDGLGRVVSVTYPDKTCERSLYDNGSGLLLASRDRTGQWLVYEYTDLGGRLEKIFRSVKEQPTTCDSGITSPPDRLEEVAWYIYDIAGRISTISGKSARIEFEAYDLGGRPGITRTVRFRTDAQGNKTIFDTHTQKHVWNAFGERELWSMPVPGSTVPDQASASVWRSWVGETYDAAGNLVTQKARLRTDSPVGLPISQSFARSAGRLALRERPIAGDAWLQTLFGYAEAGIDPVAPDLPLVTPAPGAYSGLLGRVETLVSGVTLAGQAMERDSALRASSAANLGLGGRLTRWIYDTRDRLAESNIDVPAAATANIPRVSDTLSPADFRSMRSVERFTSAGPIGAVAKAVLPTWTATEKPDDAHKIATLAIESIPAQERTFLFDGGRRSNDGVWAAAYDLLGFLTELRRVDGNTTHTPRYEYEYDPRGRLVGRRACENLDSDPCRLETRTKALEHDGLPAETTFVWDLVTDRLVAIFEAGKSDGAGQDRYAGLLRQYIHGDQGYDDPVEVIATDYLRSSTPVRYLPIIDQAGGGSVSAVMDDRGDLVERTLFGDAYGAAPRYLHGAVADAMDLDAAKDANGTVVRVTWKVHFSEKLRANSLADGFSVVALDENDVVAIELKPTVAIDDKDPYAATVTLSGAQWLQIRSNANVAAVRVAVTDKLRVLGWGESPVMDVPEWLKALVAINSASNAPVVQQESLKSLQQFLDTVASGNSGTKALWSIPDLYLAANDVSKTNLLTGFKAAPFVEPATGLLYLRNRWYDPSTGTFLTPDPMGYHDSSNLYAGFANDPVNNSDPRGTYVEGPLEILSIGLGLASFNYNMKNENWGAAAWDVFGIAADTAGLIVPGTLAVGATTSTVRGSTRALRVVRGAQLVQQVGDVGQGAYQGAMAYREGHYGHAAAYAGLSAVGGLGLTHQIRSDFLGSGFGVRRYFQVRAFERSIGSMDDVQRGIYLQRLQKFGVDSAWKITNPPSTNVTRDKGLAVEKALLGNREGLPDGFETFDDFQDGLATSVKSMDFVNHYARRGSALRTIKKYFGKIESFEGYELENVALFPADISSQLLHIGIPPNLTFRQYEELLRAVELGRSRNISTIFTNVP